MKVIPTKVALLFAVCTASLIPGASWAQEKTRGRAVNAGETVTRSGTVKRQIPPRKAKLSKRRRPAVDEKAEVAERVYSP